MTNDELLPVPPLEDPTKDYYPKDKYRIALIIDGTVYQVLIMEAPEAAKYLSNPVFVQVPKMTNCEPVFKWDGQQFSDSAL